MTKTHKKGTRANHINMSFKVNKLCCIISEPEGKGAEKRGN